MNVGHSAENGQCITRCHFVRKDCPSKAENIAVTVKANVPDALTIFRLGIEYHHRKSA